MYECYNKCINIAVVIIIIIIIILLNVFYRKTLNLQYYHLWMLMELLFGWNHQEDLSADL